MTENEYITAFRFGFGIMSKKFDPETELSISLANKTDLQIASTRILETRNALKDYRQSARDPALKKTLQDLLQSYAIGDLHTAIMEAATSDAMFTHRLSAFWANHFSLGKGKQILRSVSGIYEPVLRQKMFGTFSQLLIAAELHPAMVYYLNVDESVGASSKLGQRKGKGFNENLGREILELHTLGINGGYSQSDVIALSKLLTGWHISSDTGNVEFTLNRAEPGSKSLLGKSFGSAKAQAEDLHNALGALADHPATAHFISTKLARHFFGPNSENSAHALAATFKSSGGNLTEVYQTLLSLKEAKAPLGGQNRNDYEFLISALRASPLRPNVFDEEQKKDGSAKPNPIVRSAYRGFTQKLWQAPSPKGWPDDPGFWISPTVMTARLKQIPTLVHQYSDVDPLVFADAALGPLLSANTRNTLKLASNRLQSIGLALASPDFNRR